MKNAELSWAVRGLASLVISGFCLPTISWAQAKVDTGTTVSDTVALRSATVAQTVVAAQPSQLHHRYNR